MKKILAINFLILIFSFQIFSQDKLVTFEKDNFSVELPQTPVQINLNFLDAEKKLPVRKPAYAVFTDQTTFYISVFENIDKSHYKEIYLFAKQNNAKVKDHEISKLSAKTITFVEKSGFKHRILAVENSSNFYIFQTVSSLEKVKSINKFFSTIRFKTTTKQSRSKLENITNEIEQIILKQLKNQKPMENRNCKNEFVSAFEERKKASNMGIKILSKPKPDYTKLAFIYSTQGSIRLKLVFNSDGTISKITPTAKLPFGLTDKAAEAAKRICFLPARAKRKTFTVAKIVHYSFTIY